MVYSKRLVVALTAALALHTLILASGAHFLNRRAVSLASRDEPLLLNLVESPDPRPAYRLVETSQPATEPVEETDLISTQDSNAADRSDDDGERLAPHFAEASEFDEAPLPPAEHGPAPEPEPPPKPETTGPPSREILDMTALDPMPLTGPGESGDDRFEVAQAPATPQVPEPTPARGPRGRLHGGVRETGFLAFEAMRHEVAPYFEKIRRAVRREWYAALQLNYSGVLPTKAVLECAINPQGELVYVNIVSRGNSPSYAPLCKMAIEKAGPFGPFPFKVPDVYRNKNLEITWTFHFL